MFNKVKFKDKCSSPEKLTFEILSETSLKDLTKAGYKPEAYKTLYKNFLIDPQAVLVELGLIKVGSNKTEEGSNNLDKNIKVEIIYPKGEEGYFSEDSFRLELPKTIKEKVKSIRSNMDSITFYWFQNIAPEWFASLWGPKAVYFVTNDKNEQIIDYVPVLDLNFNEKKLIQLKNNSLLKDESPEKIKLREYIKVKIEQKSQILMDEKTKGFVIDEKEVAALLDKIFFYGKSIPETWLFLEDNEDDLITILKDNFKHNFEYDSEKIASFKKLNSSLKTFEVFQFIFKQNVKDFSDRMDLFFKYTEKNQTFSNLKEIFTFPDEWIQYLNKSLGSDKSSSDKELILLYLLELNTKSKKNEVEKINILEVCKDIFDGSKEVFDFFLNIVKSPSDSDKISDIIFKLSMGK